MSNKSILESYMDGIRASDHVIVLSCLTDDVAWDMSGFFYLVGKAAFDGKIEIAPMQLTQAILSADFI